tara:strand:+ start:533 stop:802 length:270 start_codon:yes stop_codon:yes gene_type:complete
MANVKIPTPLRRFTNEEGEVQVDGNNIIELIENLEKNYPGMKKRLLDEEGKVRKFINIYVGDEDIRFLQKEETKIDGKDINIVPSIAGG